MSAPSVTTRPVRRASGERVDDHVAREEPLEIRVEGEPFVVTMRTPGHDLDLAAGWLFSEGIVEVSDDLQALAHVGPADVSGGRNTVDAVLAGGVATHRADLEGKRRSVYANSACGVCGSASIEQLLVTAGPLQTRWQLDEALLSGLPAELRRAQDGFRATGGLHGAALVGRDGRIQVVREDVGRHNAVDKLIGWRLRQDRVPLDDVALLVSSRIGFEIVHKALVARIPQVLALGAASSLAVDLAAATGVALVGFLRADGAVRYTDGS